MVFPQSNFLRKCANFFSTLFLSLHKNNALLFDLLFILMPILFLTHHEKIKVGTTLRYSNFHFSFYIVVNYRFSVTFVYELTICLIYAMLHLCPQEYLTLLRQSFLWHFYPTFLSAKLKARKAVFTASCASLNL